MRGRGARHARWLALLLVVAAGPLTGCATPGTAAAEAVALDFARASTDAPTGCGLLAGVTREQLTSQTGQSCADSLTGARLPASTAVVSSEVDGHSAQVVLDHDTVFLALLDSGWAVIAAGCTRTSTDPAVPYDCAVEAG